MELDFSRQTRQGDTFFIGVTSLPEGDMTSIPAQAGRIIVAEGEVTGHHHAIDADMAQAVEVAGHVFIVVPDGDFAVIEHEEHDAAPLFGNMLSAAQVEYSPAEIRRVVD